MNKILAYFHNSYTELTTKVSWPSGKLLQEATIIVIVSSLILSLIIFAMDASLGVVIKNIYSLFK